MKISEKLKGNLITTAIGLSYASVILAALAVYDSIQPIMPALSAHPQAEAIAGVAPFLVLIIGVFATTKFWVDTNHLEL